MLEEAKNPNTCPERLQEIWVFILNNLPDDEWKEHAKALALNPNVSRSLFDVMSMNLARWTIHNPLLVFLIMEDPNLRWLSPTSVYSLWLEAKVQDIGTLVPILRRIFLKPYRSGEHFITF